MTYLIAGISGSGKSTIGKAFAKQFRKSFYIEVDSLRNYVVSGYSSPQEWNEETTKQVELATVNAISLALNADKYGFEVVIDDAVFKEQEKLYLSNLPNALKFWICPDLSTILKRNSERQKNIPEKLVQALYSHLDYRKTSKDWIQLDTTELSISESVQRILDLSGNA